MSAFQGSQSYKNRILQLHDLDVTDHIFLVITIAVQVFELKPVECSICRKGFRKINNGIFIQQENQ
jgi:hypothetical protein